MRKARILAIVGCVMMCNHAAAAPRTVDFSGYEWMVRSSSRASAPGPNFFASTADAVWVDDTGALHLSIEEKNSQWYSSEVTCRERMGYGEYMIRIRGRIDSYDPQTVFGFFTWDRQNPPHYSEMDIEFSRWGNPLRDVGQFTVQPHTEEGNAYIFPVDLTGELTTHVILWEPDRIVFRSWHGGGTDGSLIAEWTNEGSGIPVPDRCAIHFNFWLYQGKPPQSGQNQEITITEFAYTALP
jgi:hypothetical protein